MIELNHMNEFLKHCLVVALRNTMSTPSRQQSPTSFAKAIDDQTKVIFLESIGKSIAPIPGKAYQVICLPILKGEQE